MLSSNLPDLIGEYLPHHKFSRLDRSRLAPRMSFGRHHGPAAPDAKAAAVLILMIQRGEEWRFPLTVRQSYLPDHAGQISFPGGVLEPGEASHEGALRETEEEIGVPSSSIRLLGRLADLNLYNSNFRVVPWIGYVPESPHFSPNRTEVAELFEMPLSAITNENSTETMEICRGQLRFAAPYFSWQDHRIWGATSMILSEFGEVVRRVAHPS